jgi:hypothetical protein
MGRRQLAPGLGQLRQTGVRAFPELEEPPVLGAGAVDVPALLEDLQHVSRFEHRRPLRADVRRQQPAIDLDGAAQVAARLPDARQTVARRGVVG